MQQNHLLSLVLCSILILNIIVIILLNNRLADKEAQPIQEPIVKVAPKAVLPVVKSVVLEDTKHCPDCYNIRQYVDVLKESFPLESETASPQAIQLFAPSRLPALAFNGTLANYSWFLEGWEQVGMIINITQGQYKGTWYVLPSQNPPYLVGDKVFGRITVTYVTMSSCRECYDVFVTRNFMNSSRITPFKEIIIDAATADGKAIVAQYNLTAVPTIIMSSEAEEYKNLQPGWNVIGTVEPDGSYVLRQLQRLNVTYYDLQHKKVMIP